MKKGIMAQRHNGVTGRICIIGDWRQASGDLEGGKR